jgi:hypothetical protein
MATEEFISVTKIKSEYASPQNGEKVYQVQGNEFGAAIMNVGVMVKPHDVLISEFDMLDYKCYIVSKIYDVDALKIANDHNNFVLIKIIICKTSDVPLITLCYNFKTIINILNCISEKDDKKQIFGTFSITLHYQDKYAILQECDKFHDNMIAELTEYLLDEQVLDLLDELEN